MGLANLVGIVALQMPMPPSLGCTFDVVALALNGYFVVALDKDGDVVALEVERWRSYFPSWWKASGALTATECLPCSWTTSFP